MSVPGAVGYLDVLYDFSSYDPDEVKRTFENRRLSNDPLDLSGVWRYRELMPFCTDLTKVVSMQEGNTPFMKPHVAPSILGCTTLSKTSGSEPDRLL